MKKLSSLLEFRNEAAARYKTTRFWENKLEPAFGWHLLHFLMDSQYAGEIPEGTESLQEFKKNLAAVYNPAELKHGSVWILFAIKEQLADLPVPFRKDGFLLPFEWRNGAEITEHSPLLPEALRDLADKVKAQFGGEAANFYLYPDSCFQDQVDFSMPNTSFESGWGALVSGLYLALHPKTLLVEWPFSSIQYDFANKKMDKVGHLEEKLTLAASFKAEEFAVAPCQYKEAVHSLAKLQDNLPRKHPIQKMKIFMAKNSRNIEKTAAHIVRCNQHNWQRLIRNVSIVLLLLAIIAGVTYWDHNYREYTEYYIHYTEKGGIPVGIFKLNSPGDIKAAHCAFIYRGRTALFGERILRKVEVRDPAGHLAEIDRKCLDYENVQNLHYTVDENGAQKLATIDVKDDKRKTLFTKHFLSNNFVDFYSAKGTHGISDSTFGATFAKVSEVPSHAKISRWGIIRNKVSGFTEKIIFYADNKLDSLPAANTEGYCGWEFERDPYGRETARYFLDDKGKRMELKDGSFEIKRIYKGRFLSAVQWRNTKKEVIKEIKLAVDPATGAVSERAHFINGLPGKIDETFKVKFEYYPNGLCKKRLFFDGQDQRFFKNDSAFGSEYFYYPNGKLRKQIYLSKDGKPMKCSTGVAGYECEYDKNLRVKRVCFLGEDGKTPTLHADGIAGWKDEYDSEGNLKQRMFFDTNGRTCLHKAGNAGWRAEFDALGRQEKCVALGIDGKMIALSDGIAGWNVEYKDSYTKRLYFNAEGKVCLHKDGNAGWISEFDSLGRQTKYTYLGVDGKPVLSSTGVAGWNDEYDSRGNRTKRMFFDAAGKVCLHKDGNAGWEAEFDSLGRQTKYTYLGVDGNPVLSSTGVAGWNDEYDSRGNHTKRIYFNTEGRVCLHKDGNAGWEAEFDNWGRQTKLTYLGTDQKPVLTAIGIAGWNAEFDNRGNQTKQMYFGTDGKVCLHKDGNAGWEAEFDSLGRQTKVTYLGTDEKAFLTSKGISGWKAEFDSRGNETKRMFFGTDGKVCLHKDGNAGWKAEFDSLGRQTKYTYLGVDGNPVLSSTGVAGWNDKYDSRGNHIKRMYFDTEGRVCLHKDGNAGWKAEFDSLGRQTKVTYLGTDEKAFLTSVGIAGWKAEFDSRGNETKRMYVDTADKVCLYKDGNAGWKAEFDSLGRQTKVTYLGTDEKAFLTSEGIAGWKNEYNLQGKCTKRMFFGTDGKVCLHKDGNAGWEAEFDSLGRQTKGIFLGVDEKPILLTSVGIAGWAARYDTRGNRIEQINLGKDKSFCLNKNGWVRWKKRFNHKNELIEQMFYGKNNRLQKHWCRIVKVSLVSLKGSRIAAGDISLNYSNAAENDILVNVVEKNKKMFFARKTSDGTYRIFEEYLPDKQIILNPENIEFADYQKLRTAYEKYRKRTNNFPERK